MRSQTIIEINEEAVALDSRTLYSLKIWVDGDPIHRERTARMYDSESDAITSARHAINEFRKQKARKP